jgi:hypothetical protein
MPIEEPGFVRPMPVKLDAPFRERKMGSPCTFPGCHFVSVGRDIEEMKYDMEMHCRNIHYRDSRENYRLARRGLMDHVFPTPGTAGVPPMLTRRVPQPPSYPPPPAVEYLKSIAPRKVA